MTKTIKLWEEIRNLLKEYVVKARSGIDTNIVIGSAVLDTSNPMPVENGASTFHVEVDALPTITVNTSDIVNEIAANGIKLDDIKTVLEIQDILANKLPFRLDTVGDPSYVAVSNSSGNAVVLKVDETLGTVLYFETTEAYVESNWANRSSWTYLTPSNI